MPARLKKTPRYLEGGDIFNQNVLGGALGGAATGAALGPAGIIGGALIGGFSGFQQDQAQQDALIAQQKQQAIMNQQLFEQQQGVNQFFGDGGKVEINAEGSSGKKSGELEVKGGKIVKDLKTLPPHPADKTKLDFFGNTLATPGNIIVPKDQRKAYLEGDKITRRTIEHQLKRDKRERDSEELDLFRKGGGVPKAQSGLFIDPDQFGIQGQTGGFQAGSPTGTVASPSTSLAPSPSGLSPLGIQDPGLVPFGQPTQDQFGTNPDAIFDTPASGSGSGLSQALQLAPLALNLGAGLFGDTPEAQAIQNPRRTEALNLLGDRQVNFDPILREIELGEATATRDIRNVSGGDAGRFIAGRTALATGTQRTAANARMQADLINQGFRADEARAMLGVGSEEARAEQRAQGLNLSFQANQAQFLPKAAEQAASLGARKDKVTQQQETNKLLKARLQERRAEAIAAGDQSKAQFYLDEINAI
jgi:hypothetical protein